MNSATSKKACHRRQPARLDRIRAQFGATVAFLDDGKRRGQSAGAQQNGQIVGGLVVKLP